MTMTEDGRECRSEVWSRSVAMEDVGDDERDESSSSSSSMIRMPAGKGCTGLRIGGGDGDETDGDEDRVESREDDGV